MFSRPDDPLNSFTFKEASTDERGEAIELFRRVYRQDIGHIPEDELDSVAHHLIAKSPEGGIGASLRLLGPELRPFDIESFCHLSDYLSLDAVPALIGRLCISHDMRSLNDSIGLQLGLLKLAILFAKMHCITDLFIYAMPHLVAVYRLGFFTPLNCHFYYQPLAMAMQIMKLDIRELESRHQELDSPRLDFLLRSHPANFVI